MCMQKCDLGVVIMGCQNSVLYIQTLPTLIDKLSRREFNYAAGHMINKISTALKRILRMVLISLATYSG